MMPASFSEPGSVASWIGKLLDPFAAFEMIIALAVVAVAVMAPRSCGSAFEALEGAYSSITTSPRNQIVLIGLFAILVRILFLPWLGPPVPTGFDEHSLILQAQTSLAGRLANPTPPFWEHFEGIHINVVPTYASMYFPGRSAPLLLGMALFDHPWPGVLLSFALMGMAAVWMLQGWVRAPYAFLGGVLIVVRLGVFSYWVNSYWGGALTALGGMLVLGAAPRILRAPGWGTGLLMALGAVVLLLTRPYEGLLLCAPIGVVMMVLMRRRVDYPFGTMLIKVGLPVMALVVAGIGLVLAHNIATTGDALTTPYGLNRYTYATSPAFLTADRFESLEQGPGFFREFYSWENRQYARRTDPLQLMAGLLAKLYYNWNFYIGFILTPALIAGLWASRKMPMLIAPLIIFSIGYAVQTWNFPHYTSPIFSVLLIVVMKGFEWLRTWQWRGKETGLILSRAMPAGVVLAVLLPSVSVVAGWPALPINQSGKPCCALAQSNSRTEIVNALRARPGRDLILVASEKGRRPIHVPLVFNEPDIDDSEIIWAHQLGEERDRAFLRRYGDRRTIWELEWGEDGNYQLVLREKDADLGGVASPRSR